MTRARPLPITDTPRARQVIDASRMPRPVPALSASFLAPVPALLEERDPSLSAGRRLASSVALSQRLCTTMTELLRVAQVPPRT